MKSSLAETQAEPGGRSSPPEFRSPSPKSRRGSIMFHPWMSSTVTRPWRATIAPTRSAIISSSHGARSIICERWLQSSRLRSIATLISADAPSRAASPRVMRGVGGWLTLGLGSERVRGPARPPCGVIRSTEESESIPSSHDSEEAFAVWSADSGIQIDAAAIGLERGARLKRERRNEVVSDETQPGPQHNGIHSRDHQNRRDRHKRPDYSKRERERTERDGSIWINELERHEHHHGEQQQNGNVEDGAGAETEKIKRDQVPIVREAEEVIVLGLGLRPAKSINACEDDETRQPQAPSRARNDPGLQHQKHRRHGVGEVVHDVVEQRAVEGRHASLDHQPAGEGTVAGIDNRRRAHREERRAEVALRGGVDREQAERRAQSGI